MFKKLLGLSALAALAIAISVMAGALALQTIGILPPTSVRHPVLTYQAMGAFPVGSFVVDKDSKSEICPRCLNRVVGYRADERGGVALCVSVINLDSEKADVTSCAIPQETVRRQLASEIQLVLLKKAMDVRTQSLHEQEMWSSFDAKVGRRLIKSGSNE